MAIDNTENTDNAANTIEDSPTMSPHMFDISNSGWCDFHFGNISVSGISYICDPHFDLLEAISLLLAEGTPSTVTFDFEGSEAVMLVSNYGLTYIDHGGCVHEPFDERGDALLAFATQLADEIEQDIDKWALAWEGYMHEESEMQEYKEDLSDAVEGLRDAIQVHHRILHGDFSRAPSFRNLNDIYPAKMRYLA